MIGFQSEKKTQINNVKNKQENHIKRQSQVEEEISDIDEEKQEIIVKRDKLTENIKKAVLSIDKAKESNDSLFDAQILCVLCDLCGKFVFTFRGCPGPARPCPRSWAGSRVPPAPPWG